VELAADRNTKNAKGPLSARSTQEAQPTGWGEPAFEAAFQLHWPRVLNVLARLVGERAEAEDLALETFYKLHATPPAVVGEESLRGWLYRVATNLGLNALRARRRRQSYEEQAGRLDLQEYAPDNPSEEVERRLERRRVRLALTQLKPRSAQLLVLRHSGCSYAEIAAALEVSPASVGTLLARAESEFEAQFRKIQDR
jgi:RNA polymerase sigma-70 factor (ECF subfamily)